MKHQLRGPCCIGHWVLHLGSKTCHRCRLVQSAFCCSFEQAEHRDIDRFWQFNDVRKIMWNICTFLQGLHPKESTGCTQALWHDVARQEKDGHVQQMGFQWLQQCSQVTAFSQVFPDFQGLLHLRNSLDLTKDLKLAPEIHGNPGTCHGKNCAMDQWTFSSRKHLQQSAPNGWDS